MSSVAPSGLGIAVEGSNDLQNWSTVATMGPLGRGYNAPTRVLRFGFAFFRLRYGTTAGNLVIAAVGVFTSMG